MISSLVYALHAQTTQDIAAGSRIPGEHEVESCDWPYQVDFRENMCVLRTYHLAGTHKTSDCLSMRTCTMCLWMPAHLRPAW